MAIIGLKKNAVQCPCLFIENDGGDFIKIEVEKYTNPDTDDYWEGNWLIIKVSMQAGAFKGEFEGKIKTYNLKDFKRGLEREKLYRDQKGVKAYLQSYENWIEVKIVGDGRGKFDMQCVACDQPPYGNKLIFKLKIDQNDVMDLIGQVNKILEKFPVKGK